MSLEKAFAEVSNGSLSPQATDVIARIGLMSPGEVYRVIEAAKQRVALLAKDMAKRATELRKATQEASYEELELDRIFEAQEEVLKKKGWEEKVDAFQVWYDQYRQGETFQSLAAKTNAMLEKFPDGDTVQVKFEETVVVKYKMKTTLDPLYQLDNANFIKHITGGGNDIGKMDVTDICSVDTLTAEVVSAYTSDTHEEDLVSLPAVTTDKFKETISDMKEGAGELLKGVGNCDTGVAVKLLPWAQLYMKQWQAELSELQGLYKQVWEDIRTAHPHAEKDDIDIRYPELIDPSVTDVRKLFNWLDYYDNEDYVA